jgi:hypothetical protein
MSQEKKNLLLLNKENLSAADYSLKCFIYGNKTTSTNEYDSVNFNGYYNDKSHHDYI